MATEDFQLRVPSVLTEMVLSVEEEIVEFVPSRIVVFLYIYIFFCWSTQHTELDLAHWTIIHLLEGVRSGRDEDGSGGGWSAVGLVCTARREMR